MLQILKDNLPECDVNKTPGDETYEIVCSFFFVSPLTYEVVSNEKRFLKMLRSVLSRFFSAYYIYEMPCYQRYNTERDRMELVKVVTFVKE